MVTQKIKELQVLQAKAAALQSSIEVERTRELAALPAQYGYDSLAAFIKAVKSAVSTAAKAKVQAKGRKAGAKAAKPAKAAKAGKRTRTKITPELKAAVKAAVEAGKTGAEISKELGISAPSVQNIKKEFGLVKTRSAAPAAPAATEAPAAPEVAGA